MDNRFNLSGYRIVDLSKWLYPGKEDRRLDVRRYISKPMNDYHSEMDLMSHLGTHVEAPLHFNESWKDILDIPVEKYMGRAVLLNLKDIEPCAPVTAEVLDRTDGGKVKKGDIVLLNSPYSLVPFTNESNTEKDKRPYVCRETAEWLALKEIKAIGFNDTVSIEKSKKDVAEFHDILMSKDVLFLEVLKNFDQLEKEIFLIIYLPLPIAGLDSCPVRAVAVEGIPGFC